MIISEIQKKKVLLYLGKFPGYGLDLDGGSILARQLIDILKCVIGLIMIKKGIWINNIVKG